MSLIVVQLIVAGCSGLLVAAIGAVFWFGYLRSSMRSAHYRITEEERERKEQDIQEERERKERNNELQSQIDENRRKFEEHERASSDLRERIVRVEEGNKELKEDSREIKALLQELLRRANSSP